MSVLWVELGIHVRILIASSAASKEKVNACLFIFQDVFNIYFFHNFVYSTYCECLTAANSILGMNRGTNKLLYWSNKQDEALISLLLSKYLSVNIFFLKLRLWINPMAGEKFLYVLKRCVSILVGKSLFHCHFKFLMVGRSNLWFTFRSQIWLFNYLCLNQCAAF